MSSVFSKIIAGEIPCHKIYEDDFTLAFLDINPVCIGHTLVIPKKEIKDISQLDAENATYLMNSIKLVSDMLVKKLEMDGINIFSSNGAAAGQTVMHLHFHLLPRKQNDGLKTNIHENPVLDVDFKKILETINLS